MSEIAVSGRHTGAKDRAHTGRGRRSAFGNPELGYSVRAAILRRLGEAPGPLPQSELVRAVRSRAPRVLPYDDIEDAAASLFEAELVELTESGLFALSGLGAAALGRRDAPESGTN